VGGRVFGRVYVGGVRRCVRACACACVCMCMFRKRAQEPVLILAALTLTLRYQRCTEIVLPCEVAETNSMFLRCSEFEPNCWNASRFADFCLSRYGVKPQLDVVPVQYGGARIASASNILLSNGILDPWRGGGVQANVSSSVTALVIPHSAHHLDLRASNAKDPPQVTLARELEATIVEAWLRPPTH
jgi:hypothetical protein